MGNFQKKYGDSELIDTYLNQSIAEVLKELRMSKQFYCIDKYSKHNFQYIVV